MSFEEQVLAIAPLNPKNREGDCEDKYIASAKNLSRLWNREHPEQKIQEGSWAGFDSLKFEWALDHVLENINKWQSQTVANKLNDLVGAYRCKLLKRTPGFTIEMLKKLKHYGVWSTESRDKNKDAEDTKVSAELDKMEQDIRMDRGIDEQRLEEIEGAYDNPSYIELAKRTAITYRKWKDVAHIMGEGSRMRFTVWLFNFAFTSMMADGFKYPISWRYDALRTLKFSNTAPNRIYKEGEHYFVYISKDKVSKDIDPTTTKLDAQTSRMIDESFTWLPRDYFLCDSDSTSQIAAPRFGSIANQLGLNQIAVRHSIATYFWSKSDHTPGDLKRFAAMARHSSTTVSLEIYRDAISMKARKVRALFNQRKGVVEQQEPFDYNQYIKPFMNDEHVPVARKRVVRRLEAPQAPEMKQPEVQAVPAAQAQVSEMKQAAAIEPEAQPQAQQEAQAQPSHDYFEYFQVRDKDLFIHTVTKNIKL